MNARTFLIVSLSPLCMSLVCPAQVVDIRQVGPDVILSWEGDGVLQFSPTVPAAWSNDNTATSPHVMAGADPVEFFRVFYPKGFPPTLEPPGMSFAEPNAEPSRVADEMSRGWFVPEVGDEVLLHSGEACRTEIDLRIRGRGMDFIWARCYRSRHGQDTEQGNRWNFSYNVRIEGGGPHVRLFDGTGYSAYFMQQSDGRYTASEFFREGRFIPGDAFRLTFADTGVWEFLPLDGQPAAGKISSITDRNGNELTFAYDGLGRLNQVTDTLHRNIQIAYNVDGFIASVTDFAGRQVRYDYYQDFDVGGSFGDLMAAHSPAVTNTSTLNDYPLGKTTSYTYSEGFSDDRENHLLVAITDPSGRNSREYVYQHNQTNIDFLRCTTMRLGLSTEKIHFHYEKLSLSPLPGFATLQVIVNDRVGNVAEHFFDVRNRLMKLREFTGRADPSQATTAVQNRPTNPLRPGDPGFFETAWEWNDDSLPVLVLYPNGNSVSNVYDSTLSPGATRLSSGNLRERHRLPGALGGDQPVLVETWTYDSRFGSEPRAGPTTDRETGRSRGFGFVTFADDANGNTAKFEYDLRGNCTNLEHRIPGIVETFSYNGFGQLTDHVLPDNGSGHRRQDTRIYYTAGPQEGYLQQRIVDSDRNGLNLATTFEYDDLGRVTRIVDARGNDEIFEYNALDQPVRHSTRLRLATGRHIVDYFYDANDNLARVCESNADENGILDPNNGYMSRLMDFDILNRLIRMCEESGNFDVPRSPPLLLCAGLPDGEFVTTEFAYDANRNLTQVRYGEAAEGRDSNNTARVHYDERDLVFQQVLGEGGVDQSTTQYDYDLNGNTLITYTGLEDVARITQFTYDGFNRRTGATDPMGNIASFHYDANGNQVSNRVDGELVDIPGATGNVRLAETTYQYDAMDRLVQEDRAFFDSTTQAALSDGHATDHLTWSDTSQLLAEVDDNNRTNLYRYDSANRLAASTDASGNQILYSYDANSNPTVLDSIEKSDLGNPDQLFSTRYFYDELDRLAQVADNVSNTVAYAYDSRGNLVRTTDPRGDETLYEFDGMNRRVRTTHDMNGNGPDPLETVDIVLRQSWDDSSRLIGQTDDNTNLAVYVYDSLNRLVQETLADGTDTFLGYDAHGNLTTLRDANLTAVGYTYDLLNRRTDATVVPGIGISADTTFERFDYDGLSRLVEAEDDDSLLNFAYNSLGSVLEHEMNGETTGAAYDGIGNTLQCTYPGGRIVGYSYDPLDRIHAILDASNSEQCTYDFIGPDRMERMDYANQTRTDYTYDGASGTLSPPNDFGVKKRIRTLHTIPATGQVIDDRTQVWDQRYCKTSRKDQRAAGPEFRRDYTYDSLSRLVESRQFDASESLLEEIVYELDGVGNRVTVSENSLSGNYSMVSLSPLADFQVNQYSADPQFARLYDDNGNLRAVDPGGGDEFLFAFDYANRLIRLIDTNNSVTNTYSYDALGRRIQKVVSDAASPPQVSRYLYGADWNGHANVRQVVEEQNGNGATLATYVYGGGVDDVLHMQRAGVDYHFHHDDLGNVMAATDGGGAVVERYDYGDYGEPMFSDGAGLPLAESAIGNPYLFTGRRYDGETGLYYFRARYLDPVIGRFISRDPLGPWGDPANAGNGLAYVGNNPWTHTDPMGLAKENFQRTKLHVNIGTIGHVDNSTQAASKKPREIVVVGSKVKSKRLFVGGLAWATDDSAAAVPKKPREIVVVGSKVRSKRLFVGGLAWATDDAGASARDKRKQSLYFPEQMLQEIKEEASGVDTHPDFAWVPHANASPR